MSAENSQQTTTAATQNTTAGRPGARNSNANPIAPYKSAALFVGDLHPDVQERDLFDIFNAVAPVSSVRVCRHAITRVSLGYAYVNFHTIEDADKVIENMNYTTIKDRMCRLLWSQRDPAFRRSGQGNIFIKGLAEDLDSKDLHDLLSVWGNIISCKVVVDKITGVSKGYGFVHFEKKESAKQAIEKLNGNIVNGTQVTVGLFKKREERQEVMRWTNLFFKQIPNEWDEAKITEVFGAVGTIASVKLVSHDNHGGSKFGFCDYETHEDAVKAVAELNSKEVDGVGPDGKPRRLYVARFKKKWERKKEVEEARRGVKEEIAKKFLGKNLYVKNLPEDCTDDELKEFFSPYGTVTSAKVKIDKVTKKPAGFGFVCFSQKEEATKALQSTNRSMFRSKSLHVNLWQPKNDRAQLLASRAKQHSRVAGPHGMQPNMMFPPGMQVPPHFAPRAFPMRPMYRMARGYGGMQYQQQYNPQVMHRSTNGGQGQFQQFPAHLRTPAQPQPGVMRVQNTGSGLSSVDLARATDAERKTMIGNNLYPKIKEIVISSGETSDLIQGGDLAGKITGMLLDGIPDQAELVSLIETPEMLKDRVERALDVLRKDKAKRGQ